jgi:hypothetical protein
MAKLNKIFFITFLQIVISFSLFVLLMYTVFDLMTYYNFEGVQSMSMLGLLGVALLFYLKSIKKDIQENLD